VWLLDCTFLFGAGLVDCHRLGNIIVESRYGSSVFDRLAKQGLAFAIDMARHNFGAQINIFRADFKHRVDRFVAMRRAEQRLALAGVDPLLLFAQKLAGLIFDHKNSCCSHW